MPLTRCTQDGKSGWRWGQQGHCYTGKDGKKNAIKQGIAIEGPEKFKKIQESGASEMTVDDVCEVLMDPSTTDDEFSEIASAFNISMSIQTSCNITRIKGQI